MTATSDRLREYAEALAQVAAIEQMIEPEDIFGRDKHAHISLARQCVAYVMRERTGFGLVEIGRALGGRDHSTIHHATTQIARRIRMGDADDALRIVEVLKAVPPPYRRTRAIPVSSTIETDAPCEEAIKLAQTVETLATAVVAMAQSLGRQAVETRNLIRRAS